MWPEFVSEPPCAVAGGGARKRAANQEVMAAMDESGWSRLQAIAEAAHGDHVTRVRWVEFNLHAQASHVHIH